MLHRNLWIIKIEYRSKNENIGYVYILLYYIICFIQNDFIKIDLNKKI